MGPQYTRVMRAGIMHFFCDTPRSTIRAPRSSPRPNRAKSRTVPCTSQRGRIRNARNHPQTQKFKHAVAPDSSTAVQPAPGEIQERPKKGRASPLRLAPRATAHGVHTKLPVAAVDPANTERAPEGAKVSLCDGAGREMLTAVVPAGQSSEIDQPEAKR